ncbi:hypothetical protein ACL00O_00690 [Aeromonas sanarellii]|uniref:hypothetical protein n=1 Tax=Aeromonas sanarellii TaxID=633415 RepID=UPI00399FE71F
MAVTDYLKGTGTTGDPYVIHNSAALTEWLMVGCGAASAVAVLAADIDMVGYTAGSTRPNWAGTLDGYGFSIKNLAFSGQRNFTGTLKRVQFENLRTLTNQCYNGTGGTFTDVVFIGGSSAGSLLYASTTILTRVVSNSPFAIPAQSSSSTGVFALPGSGGMGTYSTDLRSSPTPYAASNFPAMTSLPSLWAVDGGSIPRLLKQNATLLTQGYLVKGVVKVGGVAKRRLVRLLSVADFVRINDALAAADGSFSLQCGYYSDAVMVATYEPYGAQLVASKAYVLGDIIHPATPNGFRYLCTTAGNSGTSLPPEPWPTTATLTVGAALFTPDPIYQPQLHGPIKPVLCDLITGLPV